MLKAQAKSPYLAVDDLGVIYCADDNLLLFIIEPAAGTANDEILHNVCVVIKDAEGIKLVFGFQVIENFIKYGNVKVEPQRYEIWVNDDMVELSRKEFDLLLYFIQRPNRIISKSMLAEAVWGDHFDDVDNYDFVYAQIKNLRKRLIAWNTTIEITSVYGMGYKLIET